MVIFVCLLCSGGCQFLIKLLDNTSIYCSIRYKSTESRSYDQKMAHTMMIDHEMRM